MVQVKAKLKFDKTKPNGTPQKLLDVTEARKYGWKSKTTLEDGLLKAYKSFINLSEVFYNYCS